MAGVDVDVTCLGIFGDELTIVNAARVSFGRNKTVLDESDERLIAYLIRNQHFSPFRHVFLRFRIRAPEFVMRQWYKHIVGCEWGHGNQLHGWNEISGRYVQMTRKDFFRPDVWRGQSADKKQGSDGAVEDQDGCQSLFESAVSTAFQTYQELLDKGVAREQARMILPMSVYTETIWTASLQAVLHFISLRNHQHAQEEIRVYAEKIRDLVMAEFPITCKYWWAQKDFICPIRKNE